MLSVVKLAEEDDDLILRGYETAGRETEAEIAIDLEDQTVSYGTEFEARFDIDPFIKYRLLNGLDDIGLTFEKLPEIESFETRAAQERPWV